MNDVLMNEVKNEKIIDKEVLDCYYNICKYYDNEQEVIIKYLR